MDILTLLKSNENNPLKELVNKINVFSNEIADELLWKLRQLSKKGPVKSLLDADTSVGRTLETALGIKINSSEKPDYKGIELKSFRSARNNRKTLFGKVPNWKLSKLKSSSQILDAFGYWRDGGFKLNCTVSTQNRNPQGLTLKLNADLEYLIENSSNPTYDDFAVWTLNELHKRLVTKHNETFWIEAEVLKIQGEEYFNYTIAEHTRKPIASQFDLLLEQGIITLDHLIKRTNTGEVSERGPLFKIKPNSLDLLFLPSKTYSLLE